jgi:hypothetical protein
MSLGDASPAGLAVNEELCDLGTVRLIRRQREDHLHRPDEVAVDEGSQNEPAALLGLGDKALECTTCLLERERRHVADRRAAGDAVVEDGRERVELLVHVGRSEAADLDLLGRGHRGQVLH